ncbi:hypothetical protein JHW43_001042 [Diplocarpon mali]|nr:hypothetical protein JHW43_001042 [Diplocarpon mali]
MFDLPNAKRIRRCDFARSRSASASDTDNENEDETSARAEWEAQLRARLAALYGPIELSAPLPTTPMSNAVQSKLLTKATLRRKSTAAPSSTSDSASGSSIQEKPALEDEEEKEEQEHQQEFEFALFAQDKASPYARKIILSNDDEIQGPGRILRPRPHTYYFAAPATGRAREEFEFAAVSGADVLKKRGQRAWGLECQWRARVLKGPPIAKVPVAGSGSGSAGKAKADPRPDPTSRLPQADTGAGPDVPLQPPNEPVRTRARPKPNKKRRILLRERRRRISAEEEARRKIAASREEAERAKRVRRNREKKVKRRLKEKAKKAEGKSRAAEGNQPDVQTAEGSQEDAHA